MHRRWLWLTIGAAVLVGMLTAAPDLFLPSKIPQEIIRASVIRTPELIERAWSLPSASTYRREITWQSNGSLCGPASLANVFRSFGAPVSAEKDVLAGTGWCWTGWCIPGLTLDELGELARARPGRSVTVLRDLSVEDFREHMRRSNDPSRRYVINFSRGTIFGAGVGHHSPIGGYLEAEDLVFVLDVNREFQPWLIDRSRLFAAMDTYDGALKRGLLLIE